MWLSRLGSGPCPPSFINPHLCLAVVFGNVTKGLDIVKKVESYGSQSGKTKERIIIADCGQLS